MKKIIFILLILILVYGCVSPQPPLQPKTTENKKDKDITKEDNKDIIDTQEKQKETVEEPKPEKEDTAEDIVGDLTDLTDDLEEFS